MCAQEVAVEAESTTADGERDGDAAEEEEVLILRSRALPSHVHK
jgi:hypothetical protein